jgi:hypothetical protein
VAGTSRTSARNKLFSIVEDRSDNWRKHAQVLADLLLASPEIDPYDRATMTKLSDLMAKHSAERAEMFARHRAELDALVKETSRTPAPQPDLDVSGWAMLGHQIGRALGERSRRKGH